MSDRYQTQVSLSIGLGFLLLLTSCGESKISQCNKLSAEISQGQSLLDNSSATNEIGAAMAETSKIDLTKTEEVKAVISKVQGHTGKFVQDIANISQEIKKVELKDPKLKELQGQYITNLELVATGFDDSGKAFATMLTAKSDPKQIEDSYKQVEGNMQKVGQAGKEVNRVVEEMNTYCKGK